MKMRVILGASAAIAILAGGTALAKEPAPTDVAAAPAAAADEKGEGDKKLICRRRVDNADVGTRIRTPGKRVCMTKADWDDERHRSQEAVRNLRTGAEATAVVGPGGNGG